MRLKDEGCILRFLAFSIPSPPWKETARRVRISGWMGGVLWIPKAFEKSAARCGSFGESSTEDRPVQGSCCAGATEIVAVVVAGHS